MTAARGALIVIEGVDRCGKTTQCERLVGALHKAGVRASAVKFPGKCLANRTSETGKLIDQYLRGSKDVDDHAAHLLFSANRWEPGLRARLEGGETLVVDRYAFSGGMDLGWCKNPDVGLLQPDLVMFLDLDPAAASRRSGYGEERYERVEFQTKVRANFHSLADAGWRMVDADRSLDEIAADMARHALQAVHDSKSTPLCSSLWTSA
ncbi:thymidylate kinase [Entophlyctis helioformis]|nr:thymidylate kinase [Entophlyctis helioformis]